MEETAVNHRKRKLSEHSDSNHNEDKLLPIRRHFDISSSQKSCSLERIAIGFSEIHKSIKLVKTINFSLYGISMTIPKHNINKDDLVISLDTSTSNAIKTNQFLAKHN